METEYALTILGKQLQITEITPEEPSEEFLRKLSEIFSPYCE